MWTIQFGRTNSGDWAIDVVFNEATDKQWKAICTLAKQYAKFHSRLCPALTVFESNKIFRFNIGQATNKPVAFETCRLTSAECEILRNQLIQTAESLHKIGLGIWLLDRRLSFNVDGFFTVIPAFWLPVFSGTEIISSGLPPECAESNLINPNPVTDIYAIASLCYRVLTGKEYDNATLPGDLFSELKKWDSVLDAALRKSPARRPQSFSIWQQNRPQVQTTSIPPIIQPPPIVASPAQENENNVKSIIQHSVAKRLLTRRNILIACILAGIIVFARSYAPNFMRRIPGLHLLAPSYQRGTGAYVVSYNNRSYDNTKWKVAWSTENINGRGSLLYISGWDKNNLTVIVSSSIMVTLQDGHWNVFNENSSSGPPLYYEKNKFFVGNKLFTGNEFTTLDDSTSIYPLYQLGYNQFCFGYNGHKFYDGKKISEMNKEEKNYSIWRKNNTKTNYSIENINNVCSFKNGSALAINFNRGKLTIYKDGLWYEYLETTHNGSVDDLWTIDENNFILVGQESITRFADGKETHPIISFSGWSYSGGWRVWGVDINKYWIMDKKGNIAQLANGQFRSVVRGPQLDDNTTFKDCWISPEGVVYAITSKEIWKLE
ncbi:MAG: hypothetical protein LBT09_06340 [Planctomycetaceae bacterium]|jgi:hypothetical protein|nr:hypothetical protein [Planctomycetaceae bacterium]